MEIELNPTEKSPVRNFQRVAREHLPFAAQSNWWISGPDIVFIDNHDIDITTR